MYALQQIMRKFILVAFVQWRHFQELHTILHKYIESILKSTVCGTTTHNSFEKYTFLFSIIFYTGTMLSLTEFYNDDFDEDWKNTKTVFTKQEINGINVFTSHRRRYHHFFSLFVFVHDHATVNKDLGKFAKLTLFILYLWTQEESMVKYAPFLCTPYTKIHTTHIYVYKFEWIPNRFILVLLMINLVQISDTKVNISSSNYIITN